MTKKAVGSSALSPFSLPLMVLLLLGSFMFPSFHLSRSQAHAASPTVSTSITGNTVTGNFSTQVLPPSGNIYGIRGGQTVGSNLFHSFGQFNVGPGDVAQFQTSNLSPTAVISNILGRVNGQQSPSNIFGTIDSATFYPSANLFLMNPYGFLFGPNATVNVGGMVAFTSADYLRLQGTGGNGMFYADSAKPTILTSAPVAAFGFLGSNPGAITVQGSQLSVTPGQSISLVGGNITIQSGTLDNGTVQSARLSAPGGQINLASVASPGEVVAGTLDYAPNVNGQSFGALGSINISQQSVIDASGNGGGTVSIRGGQFVLDNSTISANITGPGPVTNGVESIGKGIDIQVSQDAVIQNLGVLETNVTGNATPGVTYGGVHMKADRIEILGTISFEDALAGIGDFSAFTGIRSDVLPGSTGGDSGNITLEANSILLKNFAQLETQVGQFAAQAGEPGSAGDIIVRANQNIEVNFGLISSVSAGALGNSGNIELTSTHGNILITNLSSVTAQTVLGNGNAGSITVSAPEGNILLSDFADVFNATRSTGVLGGLQITAKNLQVLNQSNIGGDNFTTVATQVPGNITVTLSGSLNLDGNSSITTTAEGPSPAAGLNITAHDVSIAGGSLVSTETFSSAPGGHLNIFADSLQLASGGQLRSGSTIITGPTPSTLPRPFPSGPGGIINIHGLAGPATSMLIDGAGSGIFTTAEGTGAAGNTNIAAQSLTIQNGGTISAATTGTAPSATGGSITVNAEHVALNSQGVITADTNGIAPAGLVEINTGILAINGGSQIRSSSGAETAPIAAALSAAPTLTGGTITVQGQTGAGSQAESVTLDGAGSGVFTQSTGNRLGGDINILASGSVTLTNGATISANSTGTGNAGNIMINAGNQFAMTNSSVTTQADAASGGTIKITTTPSGTVQLTDSMISASVLDGTGGGGSVTIDPQFVLLQNSQILANAVQGPGGNIFITTNLLLPDATSVISASSQFGQQGTITIQSPISQAGGKIQPLGKTPLLPTSLLNQRCAALAKGELSSFTVAGRDSLPAEPSGWLSSPLALAIAESSGGPFSEAGGEAQGVVRGERREAGGDTPLLSLRQIAPPGFLTQTFAVDWSGCTS